MLWTRWRKIMRKESERTKQEVYKINLLQDPSIWRLYQDILNKYLKDLIAEEDIDTEWNNIT
jgi:hypothetical protein